MLEKLHKIGEVAQKVKIKSYVLRYWETEFPQLAPIRTPKGQRLYSDKMINLILKIQYLLHKQGLTIEGARKVLSGNSELLVTPISTNDTKKISTKNSSNNELTTNHSIKKDASAETLTFIQKELSVIKKLLQTSLRPVNNNEL